MIFDLPHPATCYTCPSDWLDLGVLCVLGFLSNLCPWLTSLCFLDLYWSIGLKTLLWTLNSCLGFLPSCVWVHPILKHYLPCPFNYNIAAEHKMSLYVCLFVCFIPVKDVTSAPSTGYCQMEFTTSCNYLNEFSRCQICVTFSPAQTSVPQCFLTC